MNIRTFTFNMFDEHCRILWDTPDNAIVVDPGFCNEREKGEFLSYVSDKGLSLKAILLTHAHTDHISGVGELSDLFGIPIYMDERETAIFSLSADISRIAGFQPLRTGWKFNPLHDGDVLRFGKMEFTVISTPGHSPGSVCFYEKNKGLLLSGDTLFAGAIGRSDLKGGDYDKEIVSIMEKLIWLPSETSVLPGHGPDTTIGIERTTNPFLEPFNEKEADREADPFSDIS